MVDAKLGLQTFHGQAQAAEAPSEPALQIEKAKMQARWCIDGYAG